MNKKRSYFEYNSGSDITKGAFRISASQVSKFFDTTSKWYHEHLLGEQGFTGSTATHLGTIVHAGIEMYVLEGNVDYDTIEDHISSITDPEIDKGIIREQYRTMINTALLYVQSHMPTEVEKFVFHEILDGIGAGGSIDAIRGHVELDAENNKTYPYGVDIMDWKTTSSKTQVTKFSRAYWFQQMTYAWVLSKKGIKVNNLRLVFITQHDTNRISEKTGKPLKDYPSVVYEVVEPVTEESLELIEGCMQVIAESVKAYKENPEIRYLLAQDYRLRPKARPKLFFK